MQDASSSRVFIILMIPTGVDPQLCLLLLRAHVRDLGIWVFKGETKKETKGNWGHFLIPDHCPIPLAPLETRYA